LIGFTRYSLACDEPQKQIPLSWRDFRKAQKDLLLLP